MAASAGRGTPLTNGGVGATGASGGSVIIGGTGAMAPRYAQVGAPGAPAATMTARTVAELPYDKVWEKLQQWKSLFTESISKAEKMMAESPSQNLQDRLNWFKNSLSIIENRHPDHADAARSLLHNLLQRQSKPPPAPGTAAAHPAGTAMHPHQAHPHGHAHPGHPHAQPTHPHAAHPHAHPHPHGQPQIQAHPGVVAAAPPNHGVHPGATAGAVHPSALHHPSTLHPSALHQQPNMHPGVKPPPGTVHPGTVHPSAVHHPHGQPAIQAHPGSAAAGHHPTAAAHHPGQPAHHPATMHHPGAAAAAAAGHHAVAASHQTAMHHAAGHPAAAAHHAVAAGHQSAVMHHAAGHPAAMHPSVHPAAVHRPAAPGHATTAGAAHASMAAHQAHMASQAAAAAAASSASSASSSGAAGGVQAAPSAAPAPTVMTKQQKDEFDRSWEGLQKYKQSIDTHLKTLAPTSPHYTFWVWAAEQIKAPNYSAGIVALRTIENALDPKRTAASAAASAASTAATASSAAASAAATASAAPVAAAAAPPATTNAHMPMKTVLHSIPTSLLNQHPNLNVTAAGGHHPAAATAAPNSNPSPYQYHHTIMPQYAGAQPQPSATSLPTGPSSTANVTAVAATTATAAAGVPPMQAAARPAAMPTITIKPEPSSNPNSALPGAASVVPAVNPAGTSAVAVTAPPPTAAAPPVAVHVPPPKPATPSPLIDLKTPQDYLKYITKAMLEMPPSSRSRFSQRLKDVTERHNFPRSPSSSPSPAVEPVDKRLLTDDVEQKNPQDIEQKDSATSQITNDVSSWLDSWLLPSSAIQCTDDF